MQILITNLRSDPQSLDLKFSENNQLRVLLAPGVSVDVGDMADLGEVDREPNLRALVAAGRVRVTATRESADLPQTTVGAIARYTIAADSTLVASVIGASTEAIHTAITLPVADVNVLRRVIRYRARLRVLASNASDTWLFRARLGGLTGAALVASAAIDIANDSIYQLDGDIEVRTLGGSGTFDSISYFRAPTTDTGGVDTAVVAGAIITNAPVSLVITGTCSSNNAGNSVSLQHFSAEVLPA